MNLRLTLLESSWLTGRFGFPAVTSRRNLVFFAMEIEWSLMRDLRSSVTPVGKVGRARYHY